MATPASSDWKQALEQARQQAREQLSGAWQLHVSRVEEALHANWGAHLDQLLQERLDALLPVLESQLAARVAEAADAERAAAGRALTENLNQTARRLMLAEKQEDWTLALIDAARAAAPRVAVFTCQAERLRLERSYPDIGSLDIPPGEAAALEQVMHTREPLVAAWTPREISAVFAEEIGAPADGSRVYAFPLEAQGRVIAILYADGPKQSVDVNALELLAGIAAGVWERRAPAPAPGLVTIGNAQPAAPAWSQLVPEEQERHLRAQRFARVQVAEWQLYKSEAVRLGRSHGAIYNVLKEEIDRARQQYREQFVDAGATMVDYLHLELIRKLTNEKEDLLGADYPGPLR